jgi:hypothetical protein
MREIQRKIRTKLNLAQHHPRRGATAMLVAVSLVAVVGIVALAIDGGALYDKRRSAQAAADAAALAAADDLFKNFSTNAGVDTNGTGKASALSTANANGFTNDGTNSTVTVNIPPSSGIAASQAGFAEVIVQWNQKRGFSGIFGSAAVPVQARAVACGNPGIMAVTILNTSEYGALSVSGSLTVENNGVIDVDSSAGGACAFNNATVICGGINVAGTLQNSGGTVTYTGGGHLQQGAALNGDPLSSIPEPTPSGTNYGSVTCNGTVTLSPGIYSQINISPGAKVTMAPGIYYLSASGSNGGIGFQSSDWGWEDGWFGDGWFGDGWWGEGGGWWWGHGGGNATLSGSGVMIYNQTGDNLNFQNAGAVNLSPPTSGTYRGIVLYQPRTSTTQIHLHSNNNLTLNGTLYAQNGSFSINSGGSNGTWTIGNCIAQSLQCGANSGCQVVINPNSGAPTQRPLLVE